MKYLSSQTRQNPPLSMNIFSKCLESGVTKPTKLDYSSLVHPHDEPVLTDCKNNIGAYSPLRAFFMRKISMRSHVMAKLERDTFMCAGFLCHQSVNPFQLCHHYLTVIGKASIKNIGAHSHA